jgi:hypothetical protein
MKVLGKVVVAIAIGVAGFLLVAPAAGAAPMPSTHSQSTGPGAAATAQR